MNNGLLKTCFLSIVSFIAAFLMSIVLGWVEINMTYRIIIAVIFGLIIGLIVSLYFKKHEDVEDIK